MRSSAHPRVKICCIKNVDEAWLAIEAGASAVGLVSAMPSGPGVITEEKIAVIAAAVPPAVATFLLTALVDPDAIIRQHAFCRTSTLQLCDYLEVAAYDYIRQKLPGIRLVQVIHVLSKEDVALADSIAPYVDALLLDSGNPTLEVKQLGGTGRIHDWKYSREIRERVSIPVFLAGGLRPSLVQRAIHEVGCFGLDICSGVRTDDRLDAEKLKTFFDALPSKPSRLSSFG